MAEQQTDLRKRSPRAPSAPLKESLERALLLYEREGRHPVAIDVAATDLGYKDCKSGAARSTLATLRQWGLIIRPNEGQIQVSKDVEAYKFSPELIHKQSALMRWLKNPSVYNHLLSKFSDRLPSDAALRFDLIQMGFMPDVAAEQVLIFKKSVEFADYFAVVAAGRAPTSNTPAQEINGDIEDQSQQVAETLTPAESNAAMQELGRLGQEVRGPVDRIPIRLTGGRRAYLMIPTPFYEADKSRIKAHIDLILADEVDSEGGGTA